MMKRIASCLLGAVLVTASVVYAATPLNADNLTVQTKLGTYWKGAWISLKNRTLYLAQMKINVSPDNNITGVIVWTLKKTKQASQQSKLGKRAIEYINGSFNEKCKVVNLNGTKKKDPDNIIAVDRYRLLLTDNGALLAGASSNHGNWNGLFYLRKANAPLKGRTPGKNSNGSTVQPRLPSNGVTDQGGDQSFDRR